MKQAELITNAVLAMTAFAANSLLCRMALKSGVIDAASFTSVRILSGAIALWLISGLQGKVERAAGSWTAAAALFIYAAAFSFAYIDLSAGTGALLLFGAVQTTMILYGLFRGERLNGRQQLGLGAALAGLVILLLPGISAPALSDAGLMLMAGMSWGIYSILGRDSGRPLAMTVGNFTRTVPFALALSFLLLPNLHSNVSGIVLAAISGAVTSGAGYAIWYRVVRETTAISASTMQLSVPIIAVAGGVIMLGEIISIPQIISSFAILGGIYWVIRNSANE